jgi:Family of unknown function (DUF6064)
MPFSEQQFFEVFQRYNTTVWPAQVVLFGTAIVAIAFARRGAFTDSRYVAALLALLWAWAAVIYHAKFFSAVNGAAYVFAGFFLIQSALLWWYGVVRRKLTIPGTAGRWYGVGAVLITYALFLYPAVAALSGQRYPAMPTFGVPCPTTIFTLGILMWTRSSPLILWIIPVLWGLIATQVAIQFGVYEDFGLTFAALAAVYFLFANRAARRAIHGSGVV